MAVSEMDYMNIGRGGLIPTDTWTTAYNNAKSFIIVCITVTISSYKRVVFVFIPKNEVDNTVKYFMGSGQGYLSSSSNNLDIMVQSKVTPTTITNYVYPSGGTNIVDSSTPITYYYY